jgi:hypothetical protein
VNLRFVRFAFTGEYRDEKSAGGASLYCTDQAENNRESPRVLTERAISTRESAQGLFSWLWFVFSDWWWAAKAALLLNVQGQVRTILITFFSNIRSIAVRLKGYYLLIYQSLRARF